MRADVFTDPAAFLAAAAPVVERDPVGCSVIAVQAARSSAAGTDGDGVFVVLLDGDAPVGAAMLTPPYSLFVSPVPGSPDVAAAVLLDALPGRDLPGTDGDADVADAVARAWAGRTGGTVTPAMTETVYELFGPPVSPTPPGAARLASDADLPWLYPALEHFRVEAVPFNPAPEPGLLRRRVKAGLVMLWDDGGPRALAGLNDPQGGVSRVGPVYTAPDARGRGYGGAVTAAAVQGCLDRGAARVMLYADAANPTSNGVYLRIGFRPVGRSQAFTFTR